MQFWCWKYCRSFMSSLLMELNAKQIAVARDRINGLINRTPVFTSSSFDKLVAKECFFKAENLQKTGSFKARGALYAVSCLKESGKELKGTITHSSGNHGQALAFASKKFGVPCTVVVPNDAPNAKIEPMKALGAKLVFCKPSSKDRKETCDAVMEKEGQTLVHAHNDIAVMTGQGSIAMELLEDVPDLDCIVVPIGGGGMISGIATWAKHVNPKIKIFAVEPFGKELEKSLKAGRPLWPIDGDNYLNTVADGIRTLAAGSNCFPVIRKLCEPQVLTVTDDQIIEAMKFVYQRMKLVIEPSSATGVAAVQSQRFAQIAPDCKKVAIILCGGNVDLDMLPWMAKS